MKSGARRWTNLFSDEAQNFSNLVSPGTKNARFSKKDIKSNFGKVN